MTQSSYLKCHADSLFVQDANGDLTSVNNWQGGAEAPLFYLARGKSASICRFHESVPASLREQLLALVAEETGSPLQAPIHAQAYEQILGSYTSIKPPRHGPAYCFAKQ